MSFWVTFLSTEIVKLCIIIAWFLTLFLCRWPPDRKVQLWRQRWFPACRTLLWQQLGCSIPGQVKDQLLCQISYSFCLMLLQIRHFCMSALTWICLPTLIKNDVVLLLCQILEAESFPGYRSGSKGLGDSVWLTETHSDFCCYALDVPPLPA